MPPRPQPAEVLGQPERASRVDAQRLECGPSTQERVVVGAKHRRVGIDDARARRPRPRAASSRRRRRQRRADRREQRRRLDEGLLDLGRRIRVPDDPAADPEVHGPAATANVRIVSASSRSPLPQTRPSAPIAAPRPTGSSSAIRSTAAIFGAPVTDPPGNVAASSSASPTSSRNVPSTVETRCSTPASRRGAISSGQPTLPGSQTRERSFRSRSTIITCSAASFADAWSSAAPPAGRVPLIGQVRTWRPRRSRKSSGDAETIAHPSPANGLGCSGLSPARRAASAPGSPREGRGEVLDEVDLIDVAAGDRLAHLVDGCPRTRPPSTSRSQEPISTLPLARSTT